MIDSTESFDAGIPLGFAVAAYRNTGTNRVPTVTYNSALGAVDIAQSGNSHGQWRFQNPPTMYADVGCLGFDVSIDLEILPSATKENHIGFHLRSGNREEVWQLAQYIATDNTASVGVGYGRADGSWNSGNETTGFVGYASKVIRTGERGVIRVVREGGSSLISYYLNGELLFTYSNIPSAQYLYPDLLTYNTTVRVHEVIFRSSTYEDPTTKAIGVRSNIKWVNEESQAQAWPGDPSTKGVHYHAGGVELWRALTPATQMGAWVDRSNLGYIEGYVTARKEKAPGRVVFAFIEGMVLVDSAVTDADGYYRMDNLPLGMTLTLLVTDNWGFDYSPVGANKATPTPYGD